MKDNNNMTMLVTEAKKGSQAAYEALYQKTKQMVYFTCFGLLKSEADAADQMQEAYATAFQKLDMLDDPEKFPGWINRIAINKCKDFLIQQKQWLPLSEEKDISVKVPETEEDFLPEAYLMKQDMREIVLQIMQKELSDVQYRTILLYYYDELSLTEIAEWMECSEGTIKSRLHNARELIREGVQKYEQKHDDKLYSIAVFPFLLRFFQMEAEKLQAPELNPDYLRNTKGQNPAYQQNLKQDAKPKQRKGRLQMEQKGFLSTTAGKIIAVIVALLVIWGGIAGISSIANHSGHKNNDRQTDSRGNDGSGKTDEPAYNDLICQISFIDAATGEDYLSGHIISLQFFDYEDGLSQYLVLDDKHNLYKCIERSDVSDVFEEGDTIQWDIELLYENTHLDKIEHIRKYVRHRNLYTGEVEAGADGHEDCTIIYGNGYILWDGEEYDLNAIVPVDKLSMWEELTRGLSLLIIDTNGNLHLWEGTHGLDSQTYSTYEQVGFRDFYEVPLCDELQQSGIYINVSWGSVLLSDGRLVKVTSPMNAMEGKIYDLDAYTFEERIETEGIKDIYAGCYVFEDTEGRLQINHFEVNRHNNEIVACDYEGEILDIYADHQFELLVHTTEGYYHSLPCYNLDDDDDPDPFRKLTVLESMSSPVKEIDERLWNFENTSFLFLLEDGTVWGIGIRG